MINWFQAVLTLPIILAFIIGMVVSQGVVFLVNKQRVRKGKAIKQATGFNTIVGVVIIAAMVWVMVATQQARNCAIRLNVAVAEEQRIAKIERDALFNTFFIALNPPPEIAALPQTDPARQEWGKKIGADFIGILKDAASQREKNGEIGAQAREACGT